MLFSIGSDFNVLRFFMQCILHASLIQKGRFNQDGVQLSVLHFYLKQQQQIQQLSRIF